VNHRAIGTAGPMILIILIVGFAIAGFIIFTNLGGQDGDPDCVFNPVPCPGDPPPPDVAVGDICPIPAVDGHPSCLTINSFSYVFETQQLDFTFTYREPDCPLCTGDVGDLRLRVIGGGVFITFNFTPGENTFTGNLNTLTGNQFGIIEWWVSDDFTKGVNRFRVDTSGSLLDLHAVFNP